MRTEGAPGQGVDNEYLEDLGLRNWGHPEGNQPYLWSLVTPIKYL